MISKDAALRHHAREAAAEPPPSEGQMGGALVGLQHRGNQGIREPLDLPLGTLLARDRARQRTQVVRETTLSVQHRLAGVTPRPADTITAAFIQ